MDRRDRCISVPRLAAAHGDAVESGDSGELILGEPAFLADAPRAKGKGSDMILAPLRRPGCWGPDYFFLLLLGTVCL